MNNLPEDIKSLEANLNEFVKSKEGKELNEQDLEMLNWVHRMIQQLNKLATDIQTGNI